MPFFPNEILEIYKYNESTELNPYKEPVTEYVYVTSVSCDFQTAGTNDINLEAGDILTDTYKAYIPSTVNIIEGMKFKLTGKPHTYSLVGHEIINTRFTPTTHIKLIIQIDRKVDKRLRRAS
jgi:hypothetical protein